MTTVTYAKVGPPFNFLGHMTETQRDSFYSWMNARSKNFPAISQFYQIRAQQLRKSAGLLEYYYANYSQDKPTPSFKKAPWESEGVPLLYSITNDQLPAVAMSKMKEVYKEQLQVDEEAVFWMNWLRNHIEKNEDKAQKAFEANDTVGANKTKLNEYFVDPSYNRTLVAKKNEDSYRTHLLDKSTQWDLDNAKIVPTTIET